MPTPPPAGRGARGAWGDRAEPPLVVLALHGSRNPAARRVAAGLVDAVGARLPGVEVRVAWADVEARRIADELAGQAEAVVVPVFLTEGYHVTDDLPGAIAASGCRATLTPHVGPRLVPAVVERIVEAGGPGDGVLLAAAGSRRPEAIAETEAAGGELAEALGVPVSVGYFYAGRPLDAALAELRGRGASDVTVAPYAIAPGTYEPRLRLAGVRRVAAPIGVSAVLVDAIVRLVGAVAVVTAS